MADQNEYKNSAKVKYIESKDLIVVEQEGAPTAFISANLLRHQLGMPYVKKDGTKVSREQIMKSKAEAKRKYLKAVESGTMKKAK